MKVVPLPNNKISVVDPLQKEAESLELLLKDHPTNERAYNRLMIIYRKQKEYKKELRVINKAIKTFQEKFDKDRPAYSPKIASLSKAILKATGLADKKGNNQYELGELARWKKRKLVVLNKI